MQLNGCFSDKHDVPIILNTSRDVREYGDSLVSIIYCVLYLLSNVNS